MNPEITSIQRSSVVVRRNSQPCNPAASATIPQAAVAVTTAIDVQSAWARFLNEPPRSNPVPDASSTNMNGTRKAGAQYFHDCNVVRYGPPPVIAAAANGDSAVGGDTSESTA